MAIARRTATLASSAVRSARRIHFFQMTSTTVPISFSSSTGGVFFFLSNFHHEHIHVLIVAKNEAQNEVGLGFLVGYWVCSSQTCFAICTNSWCRGIIASVYEAMQTISSPEREVKHMYFRTFPPVCTSKSTMKMKMISTSI